MHEILNLLRDGNIDYSNAPSEIQESVQLLAVTTDNFTEPFDDEEFLDDLYRFFQKNGMIKSEKTEQINIDVPTVEIKSDEDVEIPTIEIKEEDDVEIPLISETENLIEDLGQIKVEKKEELIDLDDVFDDISFDQPTISTEEIPSNLPQIVADDEPTDVVGVIYSEVKFIEFGFFKILSKSKIHNEPLVDDNGVYYFGSEDCYYCLDKNPLEKSNSLFNVMAYCKNRLMLEKMSILMNSHSNYKSKDEIDEEFYNVEVKSKLDKKSNLSLKNFTLQDPISSFEFTEISQNKLFSDKIIESKYDLFSIFSLNDLSISQYVDEFNQISYYTEDEFYEIVDDILKKNEALDFTYYIEEATTPNVKKEEKINLSQPLINKISEFSFAGKYLANIQNHVLLSRQVFPLKYHVCENLFYELNDIFDSNCEYISITDGAFVKSNLCPRFYIKDKFLNGIINTNSLHQNINNGKLVQEMYDYTTGITDYLNDKKNNLYEPFAFVPHLKKTSVNPKNELESSCVKADLEFTANGSYLMTNYYNAESVKINSALVNLVNSLPKKDSVVRSFFIVEVGKKDLQGFMLLNVVDYDIQTDLEETIALYILSLQDYEKNDYAIFTGDTPLQFNSPKIKINDWISKKSYNIIKDETAEDIEQKIEIPSVIQIEQQPEFEIDLEDVSSPTEKMISEVESETLSEITPESEAETISESEAETISESEAETISESEAEIQSLPATQPNVLKKPKQASTKKTVTTSVLKPSQMSLDLGKKHDQVFEKIESFTGDSRDIELLKQSLSIGLDYFTLEDLIIMGFNLEKWFKNDRVIEIPNHYALVRVNFLDYGFYIFTYADYIKKGYNNF